jgi:hypothetical protein
MKWILKMHYKPTMVFIAIIFSFISCTNGANKTSLLPVGIGKTDSTKAIENYYFTSPQAMGAIDETTNTISVIVPQGTNVTALAPTIIHNGKSVSPDSGTVRNFSSPVTYTVTAEDGSTQDYTVTVTEAAGAAPSIAAFFFMSPLALGTINEAGNSIAVTVPYGTNVTALVPTIIVNGAHISPSSGTMQDFTGPVSYRVTAADSSTRDYTVTVSVASLAAHEITSFSFSSPASTGVIAGTGITLSVPNETVLSALTASFATTGVSVTVVQTGMEQVSGDTVNDFTAPLTYRVRAASDYSTKDYTVTVKKRALVTTTAIAGNLTFSPNISGTGAAGGGIVADQGSSAVTERGLCWNTSGNPTLADSHASDGSGTGTFAGVSMTGLTANTVYHVRAYATNGQGTAYGNEITFDSGYAYGADHAGGYVFYNDGNSGGLVAAKVDQSTTQIWSNITNVLVTTGTAIGTGQANTIAIIGQTGHTTSAAKLCYDYDDGTYSDWFLPSKDEMNLVYLNLIARGTGNFASMFYWTSSENDSNDAWIYEPMNPPIFCAAKNFVDFMHVRAVRAF